MELGAFSISLAVKDLEASVAFYEKLGFETPGGLCGEGWTIMRNGEHVIGLFQGMFEKNMLTFNPGWNQAAENTDTFTDIREIRAALKASGIEILNDGAEGDAGPGSLVLQDPDGNPILIDQHR